MYLFVCIHAVRTGPQEPSRRKFNPRVARRWSDVPHPRGKVPMNCQDVWTYLPLLAYKISQIFLASALVTRQLAGGGRRVRRASLAQTRIPLACSLVCCLHVGIPSLFPVQANICRPVVVPVVFVASFGSFSFWRACCRVGLPCSLLSVVGDTLASFQSFVGCLAGGLAGCLFCTNTCSRFPAFLPVFQGEGEHHVHPVCA